MSFLLDSNILIDFLAGHDPARRCVTNAEGAAISMITWIEVIVGAANPAEEALIRSFLAAFDVLAVDTAVAEEAVALADVGREGGWSRCPRPTGREPRGGRAAPK